MQLEQKYVNKRDWLALYLVGPTVTGPVLDPLAVSFLNNQLYVSPVSLVFRTIESVWFPLIQNNYHIQSSSKKHLTTSK